MANIQLPYQTPIYSSLHYLACPGVAAKQNPTCDIWYDNCTVALNGYYKHDSYPNNKPCFDLYLKEGSINHISILDRTSINTLFVKHCSINLIRNILQEGYYVYFNNVDDFYVEGKQGYQSYHFPHDGMISGIDDENKTLTLIAYDINGKFRPFITSQQSFEKGLLEGLKAKNETDDLWAMRANHTQYTLNVPAIIHAIQEYLNPLISTISQDIFKCTWYGIETYEGLISCFEKVRRKEVVLRHPIMMLFWEHKKCMLHRLVQIETARNLDHQYSSEYQTIVSCLEGLRYLYLKYTMTLQDHILKSMQTKLRLLKSQEIEILSSFVQAPEVK